LINKFFRLLQLWLVILKQDETVLYLARETKGTKDFEKLRNIETDKIFCGRKHFEKLDVILIVPNKILVQKHLL